jgi:homoserine dehydrogenase
MTDPVRLGIAGLGTVGTGVVKIVQRKANLLARPLRPPGRDHRRLGPQPRQGPRRLDQLRVGGRPRRTRHARRCGRLRRAHGRQDGPAKAATEAAIAAGKHVVTANKAMLAHHGQALAELAEAAGVPALRGGGGGRYTGGQGPDRGVGGQRITRVMGVMNGTCNYILTRMDDRGPDL